MKKYSFTLLLLTSFAQIVFSQVADSLRLSTSDLPGMEETRWAKYDENSLWGYINGGADLYLEFGFSEISAQDLTYKGEKFKVDAYVMNSPKAAFGIFSVSRFSCGEALAFAQWSCVNQYQVQVAYGNVYLSVVAYSGSKKSGELAEKITEIIVSKLDIIPYDFPGILNSDLIIVDKSKIKLITGQLAMQNSSPSMENVFDAVSGYNLWVVPFTQNEQAFSMLLCEFGSENDLNAVMGRYQETLSDSFKVLTTSGGLWMLAIQSKEGKVESDTFSSLVKEFKGIYQ